MNARAFLWRLFRCLILPVMLLMPLNAGSAVESTETVQEDFTSYTRLGKHTNTEWDIWDHQLRLAKTEYATENLLAATMDSNGNAVVAWSNGLSMMLQKIDPRGNHLWKDDIDLASYVNVDPVITPFGYSVTYTLRLDTQGNVYILYFGRMNVNSPTNLYVYKLTSDGRPAWASEVLLGPYENEPEGYVFAVSPDGFLFAAWLVSDHPYPNNSRILLMMQRLSPNGQKLWGQNGLIYETGEKGIEERGLGAVADTSGNSFLVFSLDGIPAAQWFKASGNPRWAEPKQWSDGRADFGPNAVALDSQGNTWITWKNYANDVTEIRAQALTPDGSRLLPTDVRLNDNQDEYPDIEYGYTQPLGLARQTNGDFVIWWMLQYTQPSPWDNTIVFQRISTTGQKLYGQGRTFVTPLAVVAVDSQGRVLVPSHQVEPTYRTDFNPIWLTRYDSNLAPLPPDKVRLSQGSGRASSSRPAVAAGPGGKVFVAWMDTRRLDGSPHFQWFGPDGSRLLSYDRYLSSGDFKTYTEMAVAGDPQGNAVVAWVQQSGGKYNILVQRITPSGNRLWSAHVPVTSTPSTVPLSYPVVDVDASGNITVVWAVKDLQEEWITAQRLNLAGSRLWGNGIRVNEPPSTGYYIFLNPTVVATPGGAAAIFWNVVVENENHVFEGEETRWQRLNALGSKIFAQDALFAGPTIESVGKVYADVDPQGYIVAAWTVDYYSQRARRIAPNGQTIWDTNGCENDYMCPGGQPNVLVDQDGTAYFIMAYQSSLLLQKISPAGMRQWPDAIPILETSADAMQPSPAFDSTGNLVVAWTTRPGPEYPLSIGLAKFTKQGLPIWSKTGGVEDQGPFYLPAGDATSERMNTQAGPVTAARLQASLALNGGAVTFWLSNNDGAAWQKSVPGEWLTFSQPGADLRWRAVLYASPNLHSTPEISDLLIDYRASVLEPVLFLPAIGR